MNDLPIHVELRTVLTTNHTVMVDPLTPDGPEAVEIALAELQRDLSIAPGYGIVTATVLNIREQAAEDAESMIEYSPACEGSEFRVGLGSRIDIH